MLQINAWIQGIIKKIYNVKDLTYRAGYNTEISTRADGGKN